MNKVTEITNEMEQTSKAIFLSLHISTSFGCLINEDLHELKSDLQTKKYNKGDTPLPVTNPLGSQQDSVIQVIIRSSSIAEGLSSMENERDTETQLLLTLLET